MLYRRDQFELMTRAEIVTCGNVETTDYNIRKNLHRIYVLNELHLLWIDACVHTSDMHARDVRTGRVD